MPAKYSLKIKLTGFINAQITEIEDESGERSRGVFIPEAENDLFFTDDNVVYANAIAFPSRAPKNNFSHCLLLCQNAEHQEEMKERGLKSSGLGYMTFLGNADYREYKPYAKKNKAK
jgi:hypothetical protein